MQSRHSVKTTLVIMIDAFSKTYFSKKYTPFLYALSQDGALTYIEPLFAFRGIETTIFTGMWPNVHNVWTEFCYAKDQTNNKKDRLLQAMVRAVDLLPNDESKVKLRYAVKRYLFQKPHTTPDLIPAEAMSYFGPSQPKEITEPGVVGNIRTIFDVFRKKGIQFVFIEPQIWGDRSVLHKVKRLIKRKRKYHFWYLKFNHLDHLGHKFGPTPFSFREQLLRIDKYVEEIVTLLLRRNPKLGIIVLADHGMSKVYGTARISEGLGHLKSQLYKDYVAFLDSTMVRFWPFTKEAKQEIYRFLQQITFGHILTSVEKELLRVSLDPKYGEIIYAVNEGYVVHPCFFSSKFVVNGMHGYAFPKTPEAIPLLIVNDEIAESLRIERQTTYADIAQLILYSLLGEKM